MSINALLDSIDGIVWGIPTIVLILATGLILTVRARGIQFTKFGRAFRSIFKENEGKGELSGFAALCTALVVIGGIKRISKVAEKVVPAMAVVYVFLGLAIVIAFYGDGHSVQFLLMLCIALSGVVARETKAYFEKYPTL